VYTYLPKGGLRNTNHQISLDASPAVGLVLNTGRKRGARGEDVGVSGGDVSGGGVSVGGVSEGGVSGGGLDSAPQRERELKSRARALEPEFI